MSWKTTLALLAGGGLLGALVAYLLMRETGGDVDVTEAIDDDLDDVRHEDGEGDLAEAMMTQDLGAEE